MLTSALTSTLPGQAFESILWRHEGPVLTAEVVERLRAAGVTAVSVDQGEDPAPVRALGMDFYLDHAAGKGTLHLREKTFEDARKRWLAVRDVSSTNLSTEERRLLARPVPLLDERAMARAAALVRERATRAGAHGARMISLDDEISTTRFTNPIDWCFAASSLAQFRLWLKARYGTLEDLDRVWGMRFRSWDSVVPPTTDAARARGYAHGWPKNLSAWSDHREFMDIQLARAVARLAATSRNAAPGVPVGFEGGQPPAAFGGYDWSRLLPYVDWVEPYAIGGLRELVRSWKRPDQRHFETLFPEKDPTLSRRTIARLWDAYAHALSGVIIWSSGKFFDAAPAPSDAGGAGIRLSGYGRLLAPELRKLRAPRAEWLVDARAFAGDVVILESQASVRLHWMLDSRVDGKTWPARRSSYDRANSTMHAARHAWVRLLQDLGYAFRFIAPADLSKPSMGGPRQPKVLILPSTLALASRDCDRIRAFVEAGGLVIADETPARYDERLRRRSAPALDDFFGIRRVRSERQVVGGKVQTSAIRLPSGVGLCETGLAPEGLTIARRSTDVGGSASPVKRGLGAIGIERKENEVWCQFERSVGGGRAVLLNFAVFEYAGQRLRPEFARRCRDLRTRVRGLLTAAGLKESCLVRVEGYPTILERQVFEKDGRQILVVRANCLEDDDLFRTLSARGPQPMTIVLPMAARLRDLFTGEPVGRAGRRIEATLDPVRGSYFLIEAL